MLIPEQVQAAVAAQNNAAEVERQAKRRWCEAVAVARKVWKRDLMAERERLAMDILAVELARSGKFTEAQARGYADLAKRLGKYDECALWVRVSTKLTNYRRTK